MSCALCSIRKGMFFLAMVGLSLGSGFAGESREQSIQRQKEALQKELSQFGGAEAISEKLEPLRKEVEALREAQKDNRRSFFKGTNHFNRFISPAGIAPDWHQDPVDADGRKDPIQAVIDFDRKLKAHGVDLIFVPVPSKIEAYAFEFDTKLPEGMPVSPARMETMITLLEADVEVLDILPSLKAAIGDNAIPVYETSGHHPSGYGAKIAGELVAQKLARYHFKNRKSDQLKYVERMATERVNRSVPMKAWEVVDAEGNPYQHVLDSEIAVIGDSHAFAFWTASWASHVARATGLPITDLSISSGGATAPQRLANMGVDRLKQRKVVVWIITSAAFSRSPWPVAKLVERPSLDGLISLGQFDDAFALADKLIAAGEPLGINENALNSLGYSLMGTRKYDEGIAVLKLNTVAFPKSANAFDSLGEAYARAGKRELAIENLKKSLSMAPPENVKANSIRILKRLGADFQEPEKIALDDAAMDKLLGEYSFPQEVKGTVMKQDKTLYFEMQGRPRVEMVPLDEKSFSSAEGVQLDFREESGVMEVVIGFQGQSHKGRRVSKNL